MTSVKIVNRVSRRSRKLTVFNFCSFMSTCLVVGIIRITILLVVYSARNLGERATFRSTFVLRFFASLSSLISVSVIERQFYVVDWACPDVKTFCMLSVPAAWIALSWEEDHIPIVKCLLVLFSEDHKSSCLPVSVRILVSSNSC